MNTKPIKTLIFCFLLLSFQGFSQKSWTLDDCIAYAIENSLGQQSNRYNEAISKEQWNQSKRNMLPTINVSYPSYNVSFGRTLDPVTNSFVETRFVSGLSGGLSSSITLFEAFKKWHSLSYQKLLFESSKFQAQQEQYNLAFKIMELYNSVLFQEGALEIIKEQQAVNALYHKEISKKVDLELLAKADLYDIEATISSDALEVLRAKNTLKLAKLALIQEMNFEADDIILAPELASEHISVDSNHSTTKSIFNASQTALPQLQLSQLNVEQAKKQLALQKTGYYPTIRLGGSISTRYSENFKDASGTTIPFRDQIKGNQSKYVGLSFSFPIFNNGRIRSSVKIARIQLERAKTQLTVEEQRVYKQIQELTQKNEALTAEQILNKAKLKAKEKTFDIAQKKFDKKLINLYALQMASKDFLQAKIEQVRLKAQIAIQKRTLNFYNGTFILPNIRTKTN